MQKFIQKYSIYFEPKAILLIEKCFIISCITCLLGVLLLCFYDTYYISHFLYSASLIIYRTGLMIGLFPIAFTLIIALIVFVLDVCFDSLNKYGILVLQEKVQSSYSSDNSEQNQTDSNNSEENLIEGTDVTIEDGLQETENVESTTTGEENVE